MNVNNHKLGERALKIEKQTFIWISTMHPKHLWWSNHCLALFYFLELLKGKWQSYFKLRWCWNIQGAWPPYLWLIHLCLCWWIGAWSLESADWEKKTPQQELHGQNSSREVDKCRQCKSSLPGSKSPLLFFICSVILGNIPILWCFLNWKKKNSLSHGSIMRIKWP